MKILITTPLYPPDTADIAQYVQELAKRLSAHHSVTILLYGYLPEDIPNVRIVCVDKRKPILIRLFSFFRMLLTELSHADILYTLNGRSVELPVFWGLRFKKIPHVFLPFDTTAQNTTVTSILERTSQKEIAYDANLLRPEVLPFGPHSEERMRVYEDAWHAHIQSLT